MKKLSPFDLEKYKIKKNKQRLKINVRDKLFCAKKRGKIQTVIKKKLKKSCPLLKLKSLNSSLKNKIFKTYNEGVIKNGAITANKKSTDKSIKADRDRNFRSSNTNHTANA